MELTGKALEAASSGNYPAALLFLDQAISADKTYEPAYLWRARSYLNVGQRARAEVDLNDLKQSPCCNERVCAEARELLATLGSTSVGQRPDGGGTPAPSRDALIRDMFSDDKERRVEATTALVVQIPRDPRVIPAAVSTALAKPNNGSGVVNTLVLLQNAPPGAIRANREQIVTLLDKVRDKGPLTSSRIAKLEQKFPELRAAAPARLSKYKVVLSLIKVAQDGLVNIPWTRTNNGTEWTFKVALGDDAGRKVLSVPVARYHDKRRPEVRPPNVTASVELSSDEPLLVTVNGTRTEGPLHAQGEARWDGRKELSIPVRAPNSDDGSFDFVLQFTKQGS